MTFDVTDPRRERGLDYAQVLEGVQLALRPRTYVEIGVAGGRTIRLAPSYTDVVGIDPDPRMRKRPSNTAIIRKTSDSAFGDGDLDKWLEDRLVDLAFIDGLHEFDTALRDFIEIERRCAPGSIVLIHDCLPEAPEWISDPICDIWEWTGDVWKVVEVLLNHRPDLTVSVLDAAPSGLAAVSNLDPLNTKLQSSLSEILDQARSWQWDNYVAALSHWPIEASRIEAVTSLRQGPFVEAPPVQRDLTEERVLPLPAHLRWRIGRSLTESRMSKRLQAAARLTGRGDPTR